MAVCLSIRIVPLNHKILKLNYFRSFTSKNVHHIAAAASNTLHYTTQLVVKMIRKFIMQFSWFRLAHLQNSKDQKKCPSALCLRKFTTTSSVTSRSGKGRRNTASIESTRLTEVITIYEKLTKSKDRGDGDIFRFSDDMTLTPTPTPTPIGLLHGQCYVWDYLAFIRRYGGGRICHDIGLFQISRYVQSELHLLLGGNRSDSGARTAYTTMEVLHVKTVGAIWYIRLFGFDFQVESILSGHR